MQSKLFYRIILFQFFLLLICQNSFAQPSCDEKAIMARPGKWKKGTDANMRTANQQVISRIDKMQKIVQAAYTDPKGIEPKWYRSMSNNLLVANGPLGYELNILFPIYYCMSENEMVLGDETSTWLYVYTNQFNWFMEYDRNFTVAKNPVYLLTKQVGNFHGYPLYEGIHNGISNTGEYFSRAIIITRDGQSPFTPVTQKQFLQLYLKRYELEMSEELPLMENQPVRSDAEEEAVRQKYLASIEKNTRADKVEQAKAVYLRNYQTDKQRKENGLVKLRQMYESKMKIAREMLGGLSEESAKKPAIVSSGYASDFKGFSTEETGGQRMVRLNPSYFNPSLPKYVPQFMVIYWRWEKNKISENFRGTLEENLNPDALKAMLDK